MKKAEAILAWAVDKMEERYHLLSRTGVRHISGYNQLSEEELMQRIQPENDEERKQIPTHMPYIVIIADELADLMMTAAKEVEQHIIRLAQKSRAVGIHLVLATQKPTVDVITGLIKSNLPARIAFQVASRTDSRVVLDEMGADKLLGNGDMLFLWPGTSTLLRGQGTYLSDDEINRVIASVATSEPQFVKELVQLKPAQAEGQEGGKKWSDRDDLYEAAIDVVVREGRGSVSLLQRALGIGYGRAARLIDFMAEDGIVGQYAGSQAREVIITPEQWTEMSGQGRAAAAAAAAGDGLPPKRTNKIQISAPRPMDDSAEEHGDRDMMDYGDDAEFHEDPHSHSQKQLPHDERDPIERDMHVHDDFDDEHGEHGLDDHHEAAVTVRHSRHDNDDGPHDDHLDDDTDDGGASDSSGPSSRHTARRLA
jgi:S-DNA-T family DNA segregation ATPase FtsK/SpoIIIE